MSFVNVSRAEEKDRKIRNTLSRVSRLNGSQSSQLGMMLGAKRRVRESTSPTGKLGGLLSKLGLNTGARNPLSYKVNSCLAAVDRTIDNNLIGLLGVSLDVIGVGHLLLLEQRLGNDFARLARSLIYLESFGANILGELQYALENGLNGAISNIIGMGTNIAIDAIDTATEEVFAALLPSLLMLQKELGPIIGEIDNVADAISALTNEITNDINNILYTAQGEFNSLSNIISNELFPYASTLGTTCASRPDAQSNLTRLLSQTILGR